MLSILRGSSTRAFSCPRLPRARAEFGTSGKSRYGPWRVQAWMAALQRAERHMGHALSPDTHRGQGGGAVDAHLLPHRTDRLGPAADRRPPRRDTCAATPLASPRHIYGG